MNLSTSSLERSLINRLLSEKTEYKYNLIAGVIKKGKLVTAPQFNVCNRNMHRNNFQSSLHAESNAIRHALGSRLQHSRAKGYCLLRTKKRKKSYI